MYYLPIIHNKGDFMKVLMVVSWYSPKDAEVMSAGVFHYEQSMALKPYCDTALYYPYDETLSSDFEKGEERGLLTYRRRLGKSKIPKMNFVVQICNIFSDLKKICKEYKPDVIHAHCVIPAGFAVTLFGKIHNIPVVITEHNPIEHFALDKKLIKSQVNFAYSNSKANICVSIDSMNKMKSNFKNCDFRVIYNGIYSPEAIGNDGNNYRVDGKINACIVAGFYSKDIKGYQYLLPAVAELKKQGKPIALHIVGGGDYFDYYVNMAKELDIEDCCIFHGNCPKQKVYSIVSQMDFNISASLYECSGVSVEEALLLSKPMLVTRSGGANSLVNDDVAIVVDKGSKEALIKGIEQMIERLPEFNSKTIYNYAFENFEINQVSQKYSDLYKKITNSRE